MYRNVGPWYCDSCLLSEVGFLSQWSLVAGFIVCVGFTVYGYINSKVNVKARKWK